MSHRVYREYTCVYRWRTLCWQQCKACRRCFFLRLSLWSSFNMCQLCVITQVLHSCCRCHCFDGAPTRPLALCWLSSKDSGSTPAACFLVFLFNVVADCGTIQLIVVPIRTGCGWKLLQAFNKKNNNKKKNGKSSSLSWNICYSA